MTKIIQLDTTSKSEIVTQTINDLLHKHKNAFADVITSNDNISRAFNEIDASYRRSLDILSQQYPKRVHKLHYELFSEQTKMFMERTITADIIHQFTTRKYGFLLFFLLVGLTILLWNL